MRVTLCRRDRGAEQTPEGKEGWAAGRLVSDCSHSSPLHHSCRSRAVALQQHASRGTRVSIRNDGRSKPRNTTGKALAHSSRLKFYCYHRQGQDCSVKALVQHFISIILNECSLEARCPF